MKSDEKFYISLGESRHVSLVWQEHDRMIVSFMEWMNNRNTIEAITLGPEETSSFQATRYLLKDIVHHNTAGQSNILTKNSFDEVYQSFRQGIGDLMIVPNAYEAVTLMYWDSDIDILFS